MDKPSEEDIIKECVEIMGLGYLDALGNEKYFQLYALDEDMYQSARAFLLLHGFNVGDYKENMMGWLLFRAYRNGDEVDVKNDRDY